MVKKKRAEEGGNGSNHAQMAYEGIRRMLFTNEIVPGQKISYRQIAERLGMSLTPVIQALKRLEFKGIVRHEPNRGYFTEPMSLQEVQEIYEVRELLELSLLPDIMKNLDESGIRKLRGALKTQSPPPGEDYLGDRLLRDREFHMVLASLSRRKIQLEMLQYLFDLLYLKYRGSLLFAASKDAVGSQHQPIFDAILSHDLTIAEGALKEHFRNIRAQALRALGQMIAEEAPKSG